MNITNIADSANKKRARAEQLQQDIERQVLDDITGSGHFVRHDRLSDSHGEVGLWKLGLTQVIESAGGTVGKLVVGAKKINHEQTTTAPSKQAFTDESQSASTFE